MLIILRRRRQIGKAPASDHGVALGELLVAPTARLQLAA
jgi:hypothetical protein